MDSSEKRRIELMHRARKQEISIIFGSTTGLLFSRGLELGAGDCYQSQFLKRHVATLTCTDFDETLLDRSDPDIRYGQCDAERVDSIFCGERFDLAFSSNMLPHTPDQHAVLTGIAKITEDDGILIVVAPSPLWKAIKLAVFYPLLLMQLPKRIWKRFSGLRGRQLSFSDFSNKSEKQTNNPKMPCVKSRWRQRLVPVPVGIYSGNIAELLGSRRSIWIAKLQRAGWHTIQVCKGPFIVSELGRLWNYIGSRFGLSTENIYIARKAGRSSRYEASLCKPRF